MQQPDNRQVDNDSDNDEGFIPSKNVINEKKQKEIKKQQPKNQGHRKEFLPRYILEGIMRKQPTECHQRFMRFDYVQNETKHQAPLLQDQPNLQDQRQPKTPILQQKGQKSTSKQKQKLMTPCDKYIESGSYSLVYSRYRDFRFSNDEVNFASNYLRLDCIKNGEEAKIKAIKPFEIIEDRNEEVNNNHQNHQNNPKTSTFKQTILKFDSRFQCGNLLCAFKHKKQPHTYTLFIQNDTNTYGYNHWFYFSIKNAQPQIKYRFHIVNFRKRHSFFRQGNTPVVFSLADSKKQGMSGYSKRGEDVKYGKSGIVKSYESKERFFQLSFGLEFWNDGDIYYVSAGLPYSYSKLLKNLSIYEEIAKTNKIRWSLESVGTSIGGNNIPYVTITKIQDSFQEVNQVKTFKSYRESVYAHKSQPPQTQPPNPKLKHNYSQTCKQTPKKGTVFLIARQHPGQTWSSYLMDQFMYALVAQSTPEAKYLLEKFVVKCIPMINVDGVVSGNFRCDLMGMDMNRNWKSPSALLHPQIFSIKSQIQNLLQKGHQIDVFFDLHGHSKQYNIFCYSCKTDNFQCRLLPYILSQYNQEFHFPFCTFGVSRYKMSTARALVFSMTRNPNVLTIESSFFGSKIDGKANVFEPQNFKRMAASLIKACKSYFSQDQRYHNCKQIIKERIAEFMTYKGENQNPALSGSDSEPSGDQIQITQKLDKILPKTVIQTCPQLEDIKKAAKKAKKKAKKLVEINSEKLQSNQEKSFSFIKNDTIEVGKNQNPAKTTITNWQTIRIRKSQDDKKNKTINFKKKSFMMSSNAIDEDDLGNSSKGFIRDIIDRQQHKLPFFSRERHGMVPMRLKNESLQIFKDAYNATEKHTKPRYELNMDQVHSQRRFTTKKLTTIYKDSNQKNKSIQDLPILCVLSQNKKKRQMQITQQQVHPQSKSRESSHNKVKTAIQARTEAINNLRERNRNNADFVSKIWRENIQRYGKAFSAFRIDND